jgi:hypothetical protein
VSNDNPVGRERGGEPLTVADQIAWLTNAMRAGRNGDVVLGECEAEVILSTLRSCAQNERDARRYRWLRDPHQQIAKVIDKVSGESPRGLYGEFTGFDYEYRSGEELDAAIDAQLALAGSGGSGDGRGKP